MQSCPAITNLWCSQSGTFHQSHDTRNAILRDPLFLLPKLSLGFECSLFRAGQSPFSLSDTVFTRSNPREDEDCSAALWHEGDLRASSMGRLVCPQVSSVEVFHRSCLTFSFAAWASISLHLSSAKAKTETKGIRLLQLLFIFNLWN